MRRIYLLLFVLLSGLAFAGNVPEEQARKMANAFWQSAPQTRGSSSANLQMVLQSESLATTRSSGMEPAYYVFDNTSGPGFVIVAGDDAAMPILAYSFENEFPTDNMPANLFAADFVGNPSVNFVEAKGSQNEDGSITLTLFDTMKADFIPAQPVSLADWRKEREESDQARAEELKAKSREKGYVEKSNKDEIFRYHIQRAEETDDSLEAVKTAGDDDFVLGIRPELIELDENGALDGEIYGAMPTGMESTIKVRIRDYLLTSVIFGNLHFRIGTQIRMTIASSRIMLFERSSGKLITLGSLKF